MKKLLTLAVIAASLAYYTCLPFVIANASGNPDLMAPGATTDAPTGMYMRVTAYASVPDETDDTPFITADGSRVADGIAASNVLPFGTQIQIPTLFGNKIFTIHDRMSQKIKDTIDIWMPSVHQAIVFGAEHATIVILGKAQKTLASTAK